MTGALGGMRVLIPRGGAWGDRVAALVAARGGIPVVAPLIDSSPPRDRRDLDAQRARLVAGDFSWVFVTSAAGVDALRPASVPPATRLAVVGPATAAAARDAGWQVDFEPVGVSSGAELVRQWFAAYPGETGPILVARSDLAAATVSDELQLRGHDVAVCIAYRTVGVDLPPSVRDDLVAGRIPVVLLTSLSVARELRRQIGEPPASVRFASIGPGTTQDAQHLGFPIAHTATRQSIDVLIAELAHLDIAPLKENS